MENASKALIIAGSVLIAILLISLGLAVFNSTKGITDQTNTLGDMMEVAAYNNPFTQYEGTQKGSNVKILISNVNVHNANYPDSTINLEMGSITSINIGKKYDVSIGYDDKTQKVNKITIREATT